ncbi:MAG: SDR family NAD(P)-dependent oxidoreductase, partial [Bacteroidetes bacterium]
MPEPVLILGAHSAIGRALAHVFGRAGHELLLAARRPERLADDKSDLELRYQVPVSTWAFDALAVDNHADFYAGLSPQPGIVICVFGLMHAQEEAEADWQKATEMLAVNFTGAASILHHAAAALAARKAGSIIGISSV